MIKDWVRDTVEKTYLYFTMCAHFGVGVELNEFRKLIDNSRHDWI